MQLTSRGIEMAGQQVWWLGVQPQLAGVMQAGVARQGWYLTGPLASRLVPTCHCIYVLTRNDHEYLHLHTISLLVSGGVTAVRFFFVGRNADMPTCSPLP